MNEDNWLQQLLGTNVEPSEEDTVMMMPPPQILINYPQARLCLSYQITVKRGWWR